jgi:hypothetical protein
VYASIPADMEPKQLILVLIGLYTAGYAMDSKLNKEAPQIENVPVIKQKPQRKTADENADKDLSDLLDSDSNK